LKLSFLILLILGAGLALTLFCLQHEWHRLAPGVKADRVVVEKGGRRLTLWAGRQRLKTYRIALGRTPIGPKEQEGDQRTPEGSYLIDHHKPDSAFHLALHISYPNPADLARANERGVSPGGDIMIHGLPNGRGWIGKWHRVHDWTSGCFAVTDAQIEEIWRAVPDGTPIEIRP
jgi:murein L,D-transpeptidase YafK